MEYSLEELRREIDRVDRSIVELFEERMELCTKVAEYKMTVDKPVFDRDREEQKLAGVRAIAQKDDNRSFVAELFRHLMSMSRKVQIQMMQDRKKAESDALYVDSLPKKEVTVVYQGLEGAYSHQALLGYFGETVTSYHVKTFREAMEQVSCGAADYAILPMENSSAGIVGDVYDLLTEFDNYIVDLYDLPVRHSLLGSGEASFETIRKVFAHPQALAQCSKLIEQMGWQTEEMLNTAVSAKFVAESGNSSYGAIAAKVNAQLYGLTLLKENIQNVDGNTTRFAIISNKNTFQKSAGRVCLCFELPHETGSLYFALSNLIYNDVNMTKIESRPIPERPFQYRFYVEIEGTLEVPSVQNAIRGMKAETVAFKLLGNY